MKIGVQYICRLIRPQKHLSAIPASAVSVTIPISRFGYDMDAELITDPKYSDGLFYKVTLRTKENIPTFESLSINLEYDSNLKLVNYKKPTDAKMAVVTDKNAGVVNCACVYELDSHPEEPVEFELYFATSNGYKQKHNFKSYVYNYFSNNGDIGKTITVTI